MIWRFFYDCTLIFAPSIILQLYFSTFLTKRENIIWTIVSASSVFIGLLDLILGFSSFLPDELQLSMLFPILTNMLLLKNYIKMETKTAVFLSIVSNLFFRLIKALISDAAAILFPTQLGIEVIAHSIKIYFLNSFPVICLIYISLIFLAIVLKNRFRDIADYFRKNEVSIAELLQVVVLYAIIDITNKLFSFQEGLFKGFLSLLSALFFLFLILYHLIFRWESDRLKKEKIESLERYNEAMNQINIEVNAFKHDYRNILSSLSYYINESGSEELKNYFYNDIMKIEIDKNNSSLLNNLNQFQNTYLRGLLFEESLYAAQQNVAFKIRAVVPINVQGVEPERVIRILGNLLNNAIEAAAQSDSSNSSPLK